MDVTGTVVSVPPKTLTTVRGGGVVIRVTRLPSRVVTMVCGDGDSTTILDSPPKVDSTADETVRTVGVGVTTM